MSQDSSPARIRIEGLSRIFETRHGPVVAVQDVTASIPEGQFFCVVGPSGCGKTTLLRILAGLEKRTAGSLHVRHHDRTRPLNSMVFQEQSVFPWMTVRANIGFGLAMRGVNGAVRERIVNHYMGMVGLTPFAGAYPFQLSGGMKQRVSVARAFANDPEILLMDEPFASLDEQNRLLLQEELLRLWEETRKTVVYVTHSIDEAVALGDRILVMTAHPGRVKAVVDVPFPRPRIAHRVRATPEYAHLCSQIWELLRDEAVKAREASARAG